MKWSKISKLNWLLIGLLTSAVATAGVLFQQKSRQDRLGAIGDISLLPEVEQRAYTESDLFKNKKKPGRADWLANHHEPGQTYEQYFTSKPNLPNDEHKVIYILPLGEFEEGKSPSLAVLLDYTKAYYHPMEVKLLKPVEDAQVQATSRLNGGVKQWLAGDLLQWMEKRLPKDGYAMIAVTMTDLYPNPKWNYVFGMASLADRVGVFSFARYANKDPKKVLRRAAKVLTHETGHMFGIRHCIFYECNMNGGNHLREMDGTPMPLCPVCLRKMQFAVGFNLVTRYRKLHAFYKKHGLEAEAEWMRKRIEVLTKE